MPQLQTTVLKDRATPTPIDHTFVPRDIRNDVGTAVETTGVPIGNSRLSVSCKMTPSGRFKAIVGLAVPVVQNQDVSGIIKPVIVRSGYATIEFQFDATSTEQERNNLVGMLADALAPAKTLVNDTVVKLQGVY